MNNNRLHVVCPHCDSVNGLAPERLGDWPKCGSCHKPLFEGHPVVLTGRNFTTHVTRSSLPVIVDFWAPWCGPCLSMAPAYEQAAAALEPHARLAKVDTQAYPNLAGSYDIRSIPTLIAFRDGKELARQSGAMPGASLTQWIRNQL